jgi:hypothetical protein
MADRYALLGLARARSEWFRTVAQWSTAAAIPAAFTKCVSPSELRAHLLSLRPYSAVLLDAGLPAVDRDLLSTVRDAGCVPLVVSDGRVAQDWAALGAAAVLPVPLTRELLLDALVTHATMVGQAEVPAVDSGAPAAAAPWEGAVVAVCGAGGVGTSTVAMAAAQGLAGHPGTAPRVLLADLCLRAEQAMLHDVGEVFPGIQELVEAHRGRQPGPDEVLGLTFDLPERGYQLLLGLRRARFWAALRPRAFEAAFATLRRTFGVVVCDLDADFEGEDDVGSVDIEERCHMARTAVAQAGVVLAVGRPGLKGLHSLVRVVTDLVDAGVPADRILPVITCGPRQARIRAGIGAALAELTRPVAGEMLPSPVFLPRRRVDQALRDGMPLPAPLPSLVAGAVQAGLTRSRAAGVPGPVAPQRIAPGSLGSWQQEAG